MTPARIVHVVDDDQAIRESLDLLLVSAGYIVRLHDSASALLQRLGDLEAGCIVTDVRMPEMDGLQLVSELKRRGVTLPVVVMTGHADVALAVQAMKVGVIEFIEKPFEDIVLIEAVEMAFGVEPEALALQAQRGEFSRRLQHLSAREREVFEAVSEGASNKVAAQRLGISPRTIEIYRANVMSKMGAENLSQLVRLAVRCGGR
jgi:two-component system, LuxR family, response regulator FixJ